MDGSMINAFGVVAEGEGFEPLVRFPVQRFSSFCLQRYARDPNYLQLYSIPYQRVVGYRSPVAGHHSGNQRRSALDGDEDLEADWPISAEQSLAEVPKSA
jgi:hypothetical protein